MAELTRVKTPRFRLAFPNVFQMQKFTDENGEVVKESYGIVMLFDKAEDLSQLKKLAKAAVLKRWPDKAKRPKSLRTPFRDGDTDFDKTHAGYEGSIVVRASTAYRPQAVDGTCGGEILTIEDAERLYPGCYCVAMLNAYTYDKRGNRGVAFGLQSICKVGDGDRLDGGSPGDPQEDFADDIQGSQKAAAKAAEEVTEGGLDEIEQDEQGADDDDDDLDL